MPSLELEEVKIVRLVYHLWSVLWKSMTIRFHNPCVIFFCQGAPRLNKDIVNPANHPSHRRLIQVWWPKWFRNKIWTHWGSKGETQSWKAERWWFFVLEPIDIWQRSIKKLDKIKWSIDPWWSNHSRAGSHWREPKLPFNNPPTQLQKTEHH